MNPPFKIYSEQTNIVCALGMLTIKAGLSWVLVLLNSTRIDRDYCRWSP